jgi:hypothetical protein
MYQQLIENKKNSKPIWPLKNGVANLFRINCCMVRNCESDRRDILFYARSGTPLQEWCRCLLKMFEYRVYTEHLIS